MKKRRPRESGFALLLVFLMAGIIAITLYLQIPSVAFEAQRQKEQLLIERGEQYQRAIQLFVKTNNRYPAEIKNLENFNNRRFLRHKFVDPMTGKDEWRLVHINNGVLTDSVLNKPKPGEKDQSAPNTFISEIPTVASQPVPGQAVNPALARRRGAEGAFGPGGVGPDGQPIAPAQPPPPDGAQVTPQPLPGGPVLPGQVPNAQPFPGSPAGQQNPSPFSGAVLNPTANPVTPIPPEMANQPGTQNVPGQVPGRFAAPGFPGGSAATPQQNPSSQQYVGGSNSFVGGNNSFVGGGSSTGAQPTTGANPSPFNPAQPGQGFNPGQTFTPGQSFNPGQPFTQGQPGQVNPGVPGFPQTPGVPVTPGVPITPGGMQPGANPATDLINRAIFSPRQAPPAPAPGPGSNPGQALPPGQPGQVNAGFPGFPQTPGSPAAGQPVGQQVGGGIAGVASKSESPAIMVYNDHTNYNEWEFVFDLTKQKPVQNPNTGSIGTAAANLGSTPGSAGFPGTPGTPISPSLPGFGTPGAPTPGAPTPGATTPGANQAGGGPGANPAAPGSGQVSQGGLPKGIRLGRP